MTVWKTVSKEFRFPFEPKPYQQHVLNQCPGMRRMLLPAPVGAGKTFMATCIGLYKTEEFDLDQLVFIVPASLVVQWGRWFESVCFADGQPIDVLLYNGTPKQREKADLSTSVIIMSPQIFIRDFDRLHKEIGKAFVVYDESHQGLRNVGKYDKKKKRFTNITWRSFRKFIKSRPFLLMSATPVYNPGDVYAVVKLLNPGVYPTKRYFERLHVAETNFLGSVTEWDNMDLLHDNLYSNALTIPKEMLPSLPDLVVSVVPYQLNRRHMKEYQEMVEYELLRTDDGRELDLTRVMRLFHVMQRFITAPEKLDVTRVQSNLLNMVDTILNEDRSKLVVFANYRSTNRAMLDHYKDIAVGCFSEVSRVQQQKNKDTFINSDVRVLVGNPDSLGVGTDGLQHVCYRAVFAELPITPSQFEQAIGRVHRTGQDKPCVIKCLVAEGTIQEKLFQALMDKDDILQEVVRDRKVLRDIVSC